MNADLLVAVYASALAERSAVYCSAPITSGRRYIQWVRSRGTDIKDVDHATASFPAEHHEFVVRPNLAHVRDIVRGLRAKLGVPVIDPTSVPHIPVWRQSDWLQFWERVIERFGFAVVLIDDWQYSFGCTHEFAFARQLSLPTYDERGSPITLDSGVALISQAIAEIQQIGGNVNRLEGALTSLRRDLDCEVPGISTSLMMLIAEQTQCTSKTRS